MTLLRDALERTLKEPQCARRWHGLMAAWQETRDARAREELLVLLEGTQEGDARADVMRLTFLSGASGDSRFEHAAASRVLQVAPIAIVTPRPMRDSPPGWRRAECGKTI